jgi:hypothetical protein
MGAGKSNKNWLRVRRVVDVPLRVMHGGRKVSHSPPRVVRSSASTCGSHAEILSWWSRRLRSCSAAQPQSELIPHSLLLTPTRMLLSDAPRRGRRRKQLCYIAAVGGLP